VENKKIIIGIVTVVIIISVFIFLNTRTDVTEPTKPVSIRESKGAAEERILHVASLPWEPFMYEENGEHKGIAVDIMDRALGNLNVDYDFILIPWSRALKLAETGEIDAVLGATHKEDREQYIAYTPEQLAYGRKEVIPEAYLLKIDYVLFIKNVNKGILEFESINQVILDGYTVGVNQDFSYTAKINDANWNTVVHFDEEGSFKALQNDEMDVFLANREVGLGVLNEMGLSDEITYIDTPVDASYLFLVFSKNSDYPNLDELIEKVDEEFVEIYGSGEYDEIYDSYIE